MHLVFFDENTCLSKQIRCFFSIFTIMLGGGAGSIFEMINRLKNNNSLLKKPRYFDDAKKELRIHSKIAHLDTKTTPQQLKKIREKLEEQRQQALALNVLP